MFDRDIGGLPVVARDDPRHLVGYLARKGVLAGWLRAGQEERHREPGWLSDGFQRVRSGLERVRARRR
jgi:hypothetical protein